MVKWDYHSINGLISDLQLVFQAITVVYILQIQTLSLTLRWAHLQCWWESLW